MKKGWRGSLLVQTSDPKRAQLKYRGTLAFEDGQVLLDMRGVHHDERVKFRFSDVIPGTEPVMFGLYLGLDFGRRPMCTIWIATRKEKSDDEVRELLRTHVSYDEKQLALRMPRGRPRVTRTVPEREVTLKVNDV